MLLQWKDRLLAAADEVSRKAFSLLKPYSETNLDMINQTKL